MSDGPKTFTPAEANALLPDVVPLLERLRDAHRIMSEHHDTVLEGVATNGGGKAGAAFLDASRAASAVLEALDGLGIVVRDPATGLVDFPSERDGRMVLLCFRLGEDSVAFWHPPETGIAGRRPIEE